MNHASNGERSRVRGVFYFCALRFHHLHTLDLSRRVFNDSSRVIPRRGTLVTRFVELETRLHNYRGRKIM